jgi:uncharacterized membrane protein YbhN (UPF0104 family)
VLERVKYIVSGPVSALLVALMLAGCLFLWIGVPLGWLWIGSQVQGTASLGTALAITMVGVISTIVTLSLGLSWLNHKHAELRETRDLPNSRHGALEPMLVASAGIAAVLFAVWFFGFAGASPVPLNIGY